jgi:hypothetical protein
MAATKKQQRYCLECRRHVLGQKEVMGPVMHFINLALSISTIVWALIYAVILLGDLATPYLCPYCGADTRRKLNEKERRAIAARKPADRVGFTQ